MANRTPVAIVRNECFVPEQVAKKLTFPASLKARKATAALQYGLFRRFTPKVRGYLVSGSSQALAAFRKRADLKTVGPSAITKRGIRDVLNFRSITDNSEDWVRHDVKELPHVWECLEVGCHAMEVLAGISVGSGYRFKLVFSNRRTKAPQPLQPDLVYVYVGPSPPGQLERNYITHLCDTPVEADGHIAIRNTPRDCPGVTLRDSEDKAFAHVYENSIYLNVPVGTREQIRKLETHDLFLKTFTPAWKAFLDYQRPKACKSADIDVFTAYVQQRMNTVRSQIQEDLEDTNQEIERLTRELTEASTQRMFKIKTVEAFEQIAQGQSLALPDDWRRIHSHPQVAAVRIVDDGLHVETKEIVIDHNDRRYRIGRFTIRYPFNGFFSVWAHESAHPEGINHPHISPDGTVCYGNVTTAIAEAAGEGRSADVTELILQWLTQGYNPSVAETKIEQWPLSQESRCELLASKVSL